MIAKIPVETFQVYEVCEKCGKGVYVRDGDTVLTSYPPQYRHKCNKCGDIKLFNIEYPYIIHEAKTTIEVKQFIYYLIFFIKYIIIYM